MAGDLKDLDRKFRDGFGGSGEVASETMQKAVSNWFSIYFDDQVTEQKDPSQRLACLIVQKLSRACFAEYRAEADGFAGQCLNALEKVRRRAMQLALIGGEAWLKPVPDLENGRIYFTVVRRDQALVLGRDGAGEVTELGSAARILKNGRVFTLLEKRSTDRLGRLVIESRLFESRGDRLGNRVPLGMLPETAGLTPRLELPSVGGIGLAGLRLPMENCVDGGPEGVSVYAAAAGLIQAIDKGERQLNREFENGASRVFASADLLRRSGRGRELPEGLFVGLDDDPANTGITIFSPELRESSFLARKAEQLRNLESLVGLKRGLLGLVEAAPRTATEVTSSEGDYALTIAELRECWENTARKALELAGQLGEIYGIPGAESGKPKIEFFWGDNDLRTGETIERRNI